MSSVKKEKSDYVKGDALKGTVPNFDGENFKNKDVTKWSNIKRSQDKISSVNLPGLATLGGKKTTLPRYKSK